MTSEKIYPTLNEDSCVSHYNFEEEARQALDLP